MEEKEKQNGLYAAVRGKSEEADIGSLLATQDQGGVQAWAVA